MTETAEPKAAATQGVSDSTQLLDSRHQLLKMASLFRERDRKAVEDFNDHCAWRGVTIEARLFFVESRLIDVASVLAVALEKIADMESNEELRGDAPQAQRPA